jgi:hypothetical protein
MANQGQPLASGGWCTLGEKKEKKSKEIVLSTFSCFVYPSVRLIMRC